MRNYSIQREIVQGRITGLMNILQVKLKVVGVEMDHDDIYKRMKVTDEMLYDDEQATRIMVDLENIYNIDNFEEIVNSMRITYQLNQLIDSM